MNLYRVYPRECAAALVLIAILLLLAVVAPGFFTPSNLTDLLLNNAATIVVALGAALVIATGQIDISISSQFAIASVVFGSLVKSGAQIPVALVLVVLTGAALGALNGFAVTALRAPSIVVTLAAMIAWRDWLKWITEGAWVQGLPANFQWLGMGQSTGTALILFSVALLACAVHWSLRNLSAGRQLLAYGSNPEAARLAGFATDRLAAGVFVMMGILSALAAMLNAIRFTEVPGNPGAGLELKAIAAAVVGGAAITGGRATVAGTVIGVLLLGTLGSALTFLGINPYWEKAVQGVVLLAAAASEFAGRRKARRGIHAAA